jgi:hypothetical protein
MMAKEWKPEHTLQLLKEIVTALMGLVVLGATVYYVGYVFSYVSDETKMSNAKDVLMLLLGLAGVVFGYYFGRVPADARATQAQVQADSATAQSAQVSADAQTAIVSVEELEAELSASAVAAAAVPAGTPALATFAGTTAPLGTAEVIAKLKKIREKLRETANAAR